MFAVLRRSAGCLALSLAALLAGCSSTDSAATSQPTADIVQTAVAAGDFSTLASALRAAGLIETLKGPGPFTVFAPTDEAFSKLAPGTLDDLLRPANRDRLSAILTYHVVSGKAMASDVVDLDSVTTVNGADADIRVTNGQVYVNDARVITTDIACSNGVIHVIDTVLIPEG